MFPLEPGNVLICRKTGPARELERFLFGLVTSDPTPLLGPPSSLSHPLQETDDGNGGGVQHP